MTSSLGSAEVGGAYTLYSIHVCQFSEAFPAENIKTGDMQPKNDRNGKGHSKRKEGRRWRNLKLLNISLEKLKCSRRS